MADPSLFTSVISDMANFATSLATTSTWTTWTKRDEPITMHGTAQMAANATLLNIGRIVFFGKEGGNTKSSRLRNKQTTSCEENIQCTVFL